MKIIHCADLHLDSSMRTHLSLENAALRRSELLADFAEMAGFASENGVCAILIAGDLFDVAGVSPSAMNFVRRVFTSHPEIMFFCLRGNHDGESFLSGLGDLPENVRLFSDSWTSYEHCGIVISGLELHPQNDGLLDELEPDPAHFNIVMLHGQVGPSSQKGGCPIDLQRLKHRNIDYLALGHVHEYSFSKLDERGSWCYPGCFCARGFDECGEHGCVLLDIDEKKKTFTHELLSFESRRVTEVFADISACSCSADMADAVRLELAAQGVRQKDMIRAVLTGRIPFDCEKDTAFIERLFADSYFAFEIRDESALTIDFEDHRLDKSLKGEFIRTVQAAEDLTEEEKAAVVRCGLQALTGEAFD